MISASNAAPYPGPRSFESAEKELFFGRDREVPEIFSLLVAHRAVLLYAQSGAGKTSLLRAALIPLLERQGFDVLPIARVQGAMPADFERSGAANIFTYNVLSGWSDVSAQQAGGNASGLSEFLAALPHRSDTHGDPLPRIAIFDQFEELFTAYPQYWQQRKEFIRQVAQAAEADPLLRMLFVMREDYLANLDPHLEALPEQLAARYRLERLSGEAAQHAVEGPLKDTTRKYGPGVAQLLVKQLLTSSVQAAGGARVEVSEQYVEPVQLQVVCRGLWEKLPASVTLISEEHLQAFGDVDQALTEFYERALADTVANAGVREENLRKFFSHHLITPAGTRGVVFQEKETTGGVANAAIRMLEDRHHIVRADLRLGARWYELTHDRLIEPIRRSNERWERADATRRGRLRRRVGVVLALLAVLLGAVAAWQVQDWRARKALSAEMDRLDRELRERKAKLEQEARIELARREGEQRAQLELAEARARQEQEVALQRARVQAQHRALTVGQIEALRRHRPPKITTEAILDSVANYLWSRNDDAELIRVLGKAGDLYPANYGVDDNALTTQLVVPPTAPWPLELRYNPLSEVDTAIVGYHWQAMAKTVANDWGVPIPSRLKMVEDKSLAVHEFRIEATAATGKDPGKPRASSFTVRSEPDLVAVQDPGADPKMRRVRKFLLKHNAGRVAISSSRISKTYYWAPAWTQSVWKVAGHGSFKREGVIALAAAARLLDRPELMMSPGAVKEMLKRAERLSPKAVEEALAARKGADGLAADFAEIIGRDVGLVHLGFLLNILANYPDRSSAAAVDALMTSRVAVAPVFPTALSGARAQEPAKAEPDSRIALAHQFAYEEVASWLSAPEAPIRVYLGSAVASQVVGHDKLTPELLEALAELRGKMDRRFGFNPPGVRFRLDTALAPYEFRVEVLNQSDANDDSKPVAAAPGRVLATLLGRIEFTYVSARVWWLDADRVDGMLRTDVADKLRAWLLQHYSLTDLKVLLQSQIAPQPKELDALATGEVDAAYRSIGPEQSIRDLNWLLGSLVFRESVAAPPGDRAALVAWLRGVQRSRVAGIGHDARPGGAEEQVRRGIARLAEDDIDAASEAFRSAAAGDRAGAMQSFMALYAKSVLARSETALLERTCRPPAMGRATAASAPSMSDRYEIERILQRVDTDLSLEQSRRLQLCLLRSYAAERHANLAQALVTRIDAGAAAGWQPGEQYELAASLLRLHGTSMTEPWRLDRIRALLVDSVRRMPLKDAEAVFSELFDRYPRSPSWHVKLLETLSEGRNDSFWMPYLIGNRLSYGNSAQDGRTALRLLAVAEERIPAKDPIERARLAAWVKFSVAQAWSKIYEYAQSADAYATAEQAVAAVETRAQKGWPSADDVYGLRINNSYYAGNLAEVERLAREWVSLGPEGDVARNQLVMVYLAKLDVAGALRESRGKLERHGGKDNDSLFEIAMFELVSGRPGYEGSARHVLEKTDHRYRDYIRLLLYWRLQREGRANHARALLEERWADVDRERWSERVNQGDTEVWREMLIGYFLGKVPWKRLSDPLADTAAFANSAYSQLGMTLPSIRAEAYFYNALLQHVSGDGATRRARFREQLELATRDRQLHVYEYHLARYLLKKRP